MHYFGWHSEILPKFSTCVEQEVGSHQRQVYDWYMVVWFRVRVDLVSMHFERDVYIQQVLLFFRRHGLSGSLDSLECF
jgi:hypothetical protein